MGLEWHLTSLAQRFTNVSDLLFCANFQRPWLCRASHLLREILTDHVVQNESMNRVLLLWRGPSNILFRNYG